MTEVPCATNKTVHVLDVAKPLANGRFREKQSFSPTAEIGYFIMRKWGHTLMHFNFRNNSLLILAITAVACSRIMFAFFHDPEGPNVLVVTGMAAVIYLMSSAVYLSNITPSLTGFKRSSATIFIQIFIATGFYLGLR